MTDNLYFDTDCFTSFLMVQREDILVNLYLGKMILPRAVYIEFSHYKARQQKILIDNMLRLKAVSIREIPVGSDEYKLYNELAINPPPGTKIIGRGEAAAIALSKTFGGILASNNMRDIKVYVDKFDLRHITTAGILKHAYNMGLIDETSGNIVWQDMLNKNRRLPADSFTHFLKIG